MKKRCVCLCLAILFLLGGCKNPTENSSSKTLQPVNIYCLGIAGEQRKPRQLITKSKMMDLDLPPRQLAESLLNEMKNISEYDCVSVLPENITVDSVAFYGNSVVVNLSKEYYPLLDIQKSLLASAIAMTLTQIDSISFVKVSCVAPEQESSDDLYLSSDAIILDPSAIQFNTFDLTVYLLNREDEEMQAVHRVIKTEQDTLTPDVVFSELSRQSDVDKLQSPVPRGAQLRSITITDGICVVNFMDTPQSNGQLDALSVRAITNTLCSIKNVRGVLIRIDNIPLSHYGLRGYDGVLSFNKNFVE